MIVGMHEKSAALSGEGGSADGRSGDAPVG